MIGPSGDVVVFIVDDDPAIRDSLAEVIGLHGLKTEGFPAAEPFLRAVTPHRRGCILLDVRLPDMDGLVVQRELARRGIVLPTIIMTAFADVPLAVEAMKSGALDFIQKPFPLDRLLELVRTAVRLDAENAPRLAAAAELTDRLARLTSRERDVFQLLVGGSQNKEIAFALGISPRTVEIHRARIMEKMGVRNLPELIRLALSAADEPSPRP